MAPSGPRRDSTGSKRSSPSVASASTKKSRSSDAASRIAELEAELAVISAGKGQKFKPNTEELVRIKDAIKVYIWRQVKFITNHVQAKKVCKMVWKRIQNFRREEHLTLKLFTYWYAEHVVSAFTQVRSYQMAQMEKAYQRFRDDPKPTLKEMERCLKREINLEDARQQLVFIWYWDNYLPKATGSSKLFSPNHRRYATISEAVTAQDKDLQVMTPEHEAFAVLTFENNLSRWQYYDTIRAEHGHLQFLPMKKKKPTDPDTVIEELVNGKPSLRIYNDKCKGKYTISDNGQSKYGGWTEAGMIRYKKLLGFAKAGRAKPATEVLEKATLKLVRASVGMTEEIGALDDGPALFKKTTKNADVDTWDFEESDPDEADDDATIGNEDDNSDSDGDSHRSNSRSQVDLSSVGRSAGV